jgi:hypothetical protein
LILSDEQDYLLDLCCCHLVVIRAYTDPHMGLLSHVPWVRTLDTIKITSSSFLLLFSIALTGISLFGEVNLWCSDCKGSAFYS